jgi:pimeloyl-ACP methyl ester carboxylesterase
MACRVAWPCRRYCCLVSTETKKGSAIVKFSHRWLWLAVALRTFRSSASETELANADTPWRTPPSAAWTRIGALAVFSLAWFGGTDAGGAEDVGPVAWQYRVVLEAGDPQPKGKREATAYVWLPPASKTIRGLLVGGGEEYGTAPPVRQACVDQHLGIVMMRGYLGMFRYWTEGDRDAERLLRAIGIIAQRTGHQELRRVPWITFGHSTGGIFCRNVAYWKPDRVAGVIHYKSGNFHARNVSPPEGASLAGVPMLIVNGQYETYGPDAVEHPDEKDKRLDKRYGRETQWVYVRSDIQKFRQRDPNHLMSLLLDPGGDHFFGSPELWQQMALFIRKTAERRIPAALPPGDEPVKCVRVTVEDGWLSDSDLKQPVHAAAPYADYAGDKAVAFWHYDRETAEAAARNNRNLANPQCLENPECTWLDEGDGWTFRAKSDWLDALPDSYCGPLAGRKVGHSAQPFELRCRPTDPVARIGPDTFRMLRAGAAAIAAVHPGDDTYRATNRWTMQKLPVVKGEKQTIDFPPLPDLKPGQSAELKATASSGLPVHFEVDYGPVVIESGKLVVRDLPARPQYPLECRVTAWQIGRRAGKTIESAPAVSQTFRVLAQ